MFGPIDGHGAVERVDVTGLAVHPEAHQADALVIRFADGAQAQQQPHARAEHYSGVVVMRIQPVPEQQRRQHRQVAVAVGVLVLSR